MNIGVFPGSFDPVTNGHLDLIRRASGLLDRLVVGVLINPAKSGMFLPDERAEMIRQATSDLANVEVRVFTGLTVDFARSEKANVIVRGLRNTADFDFENQLSMLNRKLAPEVETVFLNSDPAQAFISSSYVKEIAAFGGNIVDFVPTFVADRIKEKLQK